jgi:hypothetical protein
MSKKKVAHFILRQLLKDSIESLGSPHVVDQDGRIEVFRKGQTLNFASSEARLQYFADNSDYSLKQITEGVNLLAANKHIVYTDQLGEGLDQKVIKATPSGILAYNEDYYNKFDYTLWTLIFVIIGIIVSTIVGVVTCTRTH